MLRLIALLLVLLNGVFLMWSQGMWQPVAGPQDPAEPQRLRQQIRPDTLKPLTEQAQRDLEKTAESRTRQSTCLVAGVFDERQVRVLEKQLTTNWPAGSWTLEPARSTARWIIYMGKLPNAEALERKSAELAHLKVSASPIQNPALQPGLLLGAFESQADAAQALQVLSQQGVRTARVIMERAERKGQVLRLPQVDAKQQALLPGLSALVENPEWRACQGVELPWKIL
jgi:hypothetical protein